MGARTVKRRHQQQWYRFVLYCSPAGREVYSPNTAEDTADRSASRRAAPCGKARRAGARVLLSCQNEGPSERAQRSTQACLPAPALGTIELTRMPPHATHLRREQRLSGHLVVKGVVDCQRHTLPHVPARGGEQQFEYVKRQVGVSGKCKHAAPRLPQVTSTSRPSQQPGART